MTRAAFSVITPVSWTRALAHSRARRNAVSDQIRAHFSTIKDSSIVASPLSTFPLSGGSGFNHIGGGLSAGVAAKEIESVGQVHGRFGADKCPTNKNTTIRQAATLATSAAVHPAAESLSLISIAASSAALAGREAKTCAEAGGDGNQLRGASRHTKANDRAGAGAKIGPLEDAAQSALPSISAY